MGHTFSLVRAGKVKLRHGGGGGEVVPETAARSVDWARCRWDWGYVYLYLSVVLYRC